MNCWPTIIVIGPNQRVVLKVTGEDNKEVLEPALVAALEHYKDVLDPRPLPLELEKDKQLLIPGGTIDSIKEEEIIGQRQNLNNPGKVILITDAIGLPYEGVEDLMVISDSSHNRFILVDMKTMKCLETIGNGRVGFKDGSFEEAEFYHTQGMTHFQNDNGEHCLLVCDTKNHAMRLVNLHSKTVVKVAGNVGVRGFDREGGNKKANDQMIASPWDVIHVGDRRFIIAMAGTHQIWSLDLDKDKCARYSGSAAEGNLNSGPLDS